MRHVDSMRERLPELYRDGELIGGLLAHVGVQLDIVDEELTVLQRSHWFNRTVERDEAAALAALLDLAPETWQDLADFRAWLHALRNAMLERGAVTRRALESFAAEYVRLFQAAAEIVAVPRVTSWESRPNAHNLPAFVEAPLRRVVQRPLESAAAGGLEPLVTFTLHNRGLEETALTLELVGLPAAPESVPLVVNVTTGEAVLFLGDLATGQRLWLEPQADGTLTARLERQDVTSALRTVHDLEPGRAWAPDQIDAVPQALHLARGENLLWFLPVAHFDVRGLDRVLLALADLRLHQGRFDAGRFDRALFHQEARAILTAAWIEAQPACFEVHLPAGLMLSAPEELEPALEAREELVFSLDLSVDRLRAAGVGASVELVPLSDTQPQQDALLLVLPMFLREAGSTGADTIPDAGGLFEITHYQDSTFR